MNRRPAYRAFFGVSTFVGTLAVLSAAALVGCRAEPAREDVVARIGDRVLTAQDVADAVRPVGAALDSAEAARRYVDQWVTDELLAREAIRRGLRNDREVRRLIEQSERTVVIAALVERVLDESRDAVTRERVAQYFLARREQLRILEPYVRVRHLAWETLAQAREGQRRLAALDSADTGPWQAMLRTASPPDSLVREYQDRYVPESTLMPSNERFREIVGALRPGRTSDILEDGGLFHVLTVVDRAPVGTEPGFSWIEASLRTPVEIEARKQLYTRLVQDLRNEALAGKDLEIR